MRTDELSFGHFTVYTVVSSRVSQAIAPTTAATVNAPHAAIIFLVRFDSVLPPRLSISVRAVYARIVFYPAVYGYDFELILCYADIYILNPCIDYQLFAHRARLNISAELTCRRFVAGKIKRSPYHIRS